MSGYRFPLQRVLDLRNTQLTLEELRVKQQAAVLTDLERQHEDAVAAAFAAEAEVRSGNAIAGRDLEILADFRLHMRNRQKKIAVRRVEAEKNLAAQHVVMLEARQRVRLMERLRDRRQAEWVAARDKQVEETASDSFLAQRGRE